jgi:hypothetical protein
MAMKARKTTSRIGTKRMRSIYLTREMDDQIYRLYREKLKSNEVSTYSDVICQLLEKSLLYVVPAITPEVSWE